MVAVCGDGGRGKELRERERETLDSSAFLTEVIPSCRLSLSKSFDFFFPLICRFSFTVTRD